MVIELKFCPECWERAKGAADGAMLRGYDALNAVYVELRKNCIDGNGS